MIFTFNAKPSLVVQILPFQPASSPALPTLLGNVDYQDFENQLRRIDRLLIATSIEKGFVKTNL